MLYSINKEQFIKTALVNRDYVWCDLLRDTENFGGKFYFDENGTFYSSVVYGLSECVTVFGKYSSQALARAKENFKDAAGFCFALAYDEYNENDIEISRGITYLYKLQDKPDVNLSGEVGIKRIDSASASVLAAYDEKYMSFLRENHGARLANYWKNNNAALLSGKEALYLAYIGDVMIGFAMVDFYGEHNACDVSQLTVEEQFQGKGYGKQLLVLVVSDLKDSGLDIYYSSVNGDNIASQKTAEGVGFKKAACRIGVE